MISENGNSFQSVAQVRTAEVILASFFVLPVWANSTHCQLHGGDPFRVQPHLPQPCPPPSPKLPPSKPDCCTSLRWYPASTQINLQMAARGILFHLRWRPGSSGGLWDLSLVNGFLSLLCLHLLLLTSFLALPWWHWLLCCSSNMPGLLIFWSCYLEQLFPPDICISFPFNTAFDVSLVFLNWVILWKVSNILWVPLELVSSSLSNRPFGFIGSPSMTKAKTLFWHPKQWHITQMLMIQWNSPNQGF